MPFQRDYSRRLLGLARVMRHEATDAEKKLWLLLRDRKLTGFKFRRQYPVTGYVLDFYCIKAKLAVECDGGQHAEPREVLYDERRTKRLNEFGIRVFRFPDDDILKHSGAVLEAIHRALVVETEPSPRPSPGVPGEGERG